MDLQKKRKLEENGVVSPPNPAPTSAPTTTLFLDDIRKIIQPFTHEQLIQIVLTASIRHVDVLDAVRSIANRDPAQRKLFIRGLGWETTSETLRTLFSTYGDLEEAVVILDKATGMSKGYGFVTFRHIDGALTALKEPSKKIDGRMTVTQLASVGVPVTANSQTQDVSSRKIYVGNVPNDMDGDRLLAHFSSYGEVEEGPIGFDKGTGKSRGFAFFVYKNVEGARACLVDSVKTIDGHQLHCKFANDGKKGNHKVVSGAQVGAPTAAPVAQVQGPSGAVKPEASVDRLGSNLNVNQGSSTEGYFASQFGSAGPGGLSGYNGNSNSNSGGFGLQRQGPPEVSVDRLGLNVNLDHQSSIQGSLASQYGGGGPGGVSGYSGISNSSGLGLLGQGSAPTLPLSPLGHSQHSSSYSLGGGPGLSSYGSGGFSSGLGSGYGGSGSHYGGYSGSGSHFGGPGESYGGTGYGGSGQRSLYGLPPSTARMSSGGYPESAHYSLSSGEAYQSEQRKTGSSPITRVPAGGTNHGPPYN